MNIFNLLANLVQVYTWFFIARAIISWIPSIDPHNPIVQFLYQATEPVLDPVRKLIPPMGGGFDISFIIVFFGLVILQQLLRGMG